MITIVVFLIEAFSKKDDFRAGDLYWGTVILDAMIISAVFAALSA